MGFIVCGPPQETSLPRYWIGLTRAHTITFVGELVLSERWTLSKFLPDIEHFRQIRVIGKILDSAATSHGGRQLRAPIDR